MQEGFLGSGHEIVWTPQPGKIKQPRNTQGAERLERNEEMPFWWAYYYVNAKRCEKCGLISDKIDLLKKRYPLCRPAVRGLFL